MCIRHPVFDFYPATGPRLGVRISTSLDPFLGLIYAVCPDPRVLNLGCSRYGRTELAGPAGNVTGLETNKEGDQVRKAEVGAEANSRLIRGKIELASRHMQGSYIQGFDVSADGIFTRGDRVPQRQISLEGSAAIELGN